ncbi:MAG: glycosyltransferase family 4 protein [Vulcanimicrobiaceae bacterium]
MRAPLVAIVSDPLVQRGGAERCVEALAEAFPDAPIFSILYDAERGPFALASRVRESYLGRFPLASKRHRMFWPLYRNAVESFDLHAFDIIVSSHHTTAKSLLRRANQIHVCYCHTPMRAIWERPFDEIRTLPRPLRSAASAFFSSARLRDAATANRVDYFLANSRETQRRIGVHYRRPSKIVYPPIDLDRFAIGSEAAGDAYLIASRPVPYKRIDVAIDAAEKLRRRVVVTAARPPGMNTSSRISFVGSLPDAQLVELMQRSRALLFPQHEDFGMTPLEMNACGRPVIAYAAGGALETVSDGVTGVLAPDQTVDAFVDAIQRCERLSFDPLRLRAHARAFSRDRYIREIRAFVESVWLQRNARPGEIRDAALAHDRFGGAL